LGQSKKIRRVQLGPLFVGSGWWERISVALRLPIFCFTGEQNASRIRNKQKTERYWLKDLVARQGLCVFITVGKHILPGRMKVMGCGYPLNAHNTESDGIVKCFIQCHQ
jgi:hypothetical protein